jgi:hypothetical protein
MLFPIILATGSDNGVLNGESSLPSNARALEG